MMASQHLLKYQIVFEGPDRVGKTTLKQNFEKITNFKYVTIDRALLTGMVYTEKFGRPPVTYDFKQYEHVIIVLLTADPDEIYRRCIVTHEQVYDIQSDLALFHKHAKTLEDAGITIIRYDMTHVDSINVAKDLKEKVDNLNDIRI
jgi:thymidylate kinase